MMNLTSQFEGMGDDGYVVASSDETLRTSRAPKKYNRRCTSIEYEQLL
jgi:hypothetical protein